LENIVIWVGPNPNSHGYRIKVSNKPNKIDNKDLFTITIPKFEVIGTVNKSFIDIEKLEDIKKFIEKNIQIV
jgi:hypothetical protein